MELDAQHIHDRVQTGERRVALAGEQPVQALPIQPGCLGQLPHPTVGFDHVPQPEKELGFSFLKALGEIARGVFGIPSRVIRSSL